MVAALEKGDSYDHCDQHWAHHATGHRCDADDFIFAVTQSCRCSHHPSVNCCQHNLAMLSLGLSQFPECPIATAMLDESKCRVKTVRRCEAAARPCQNMPTFLETVPSLTRSERSLTPSSSLLAMHPEPAS